MLHQAFFSYIYKTLCKQSLGTRGGYLGTYYLTVVGKFKSRSHLRNLRLQATILFFKHHRLKSRKNSGYEPFATIIAMESPTKSRQYIHVQNISFRIYISECIFENLKKIRETNH